MIDFITGDKIISICDFIIITPSILNFHVNLLNFTSYEKLFIINDFNNIDNNLLFSHLNSYNKKVIKIFIYTHLINEFITFILPNLPNNLNYIIYLHNSDDSFGDNIQLHSKIIESSNILKIYSQNICYNNYQIDKLSLLPIGIANSMWQHGNLNILQHVINLQLPKINNIYINLSNTFSYRQEFINELKNNSIAVNSHVSYELYLNELSINYFSIKR